VPSQRRAVARGASEGGGSSAMPLVRPYLASAGTPRGQSGWPRSVCPQHLRSQRTSFQLCGRGFEHGGHDPGASRAPSARASEFGRSSPLCRHHGDRALVSAPRRPMSHPTSASRVATRVRDRRSRGHRRRLFDTQSWVASPPRARRVAAAGRHESSVCQRCRVLIGERARY